MTGTKRFSDVFELDRDKIAVDPKRFQGRQTHYSEESVKAIVSQGYDKSASPIVVWLDKKPAYITLSPVTVALKHPEGYLRPETNN